MENKCITYRQSSLTYHTTGNGIPILLMHGFAENHSIWQHQVEELKNNHRLIIPDLFGTGASDPLDLPDVTIEDYALAVKQIIMAERIDRFIMIGHSMGGYITLAYLEKFPADLLCVGLVHSTAYADDEEKKSVRKKSITFIQNNGSTAFLQTSIPGLFKEPAHHMVDIQAMTETGNRIKPDTLVQYQKAMMNRPDRAHILRNATIPILLLAGVYDQAAPFAHILQQTQLPDISMIGILRDTAHMGMIEEPLQINKYLKSFLTEIKSLMA